MPELPPILIAAITGLLAGFLLSIPVGPVNITIMSEGARKGFQFAFLVGLGGSIMEAVYCSIAFTGFASFFTHGVVKTVMEIFSFGFIMFLGVKFLMVKAVPAAEGYKSRLEQKFDSHSAFMIGFLRTLANPGLLLFWIVVSANFMWRGWVQPTLAAKAACIVCVGIGTNLWFSGLGYAISLGGRKMSDKVLLWIERSSGICLILLGIVHGGQIIYELIRNHH